jgi:hypothetical protein
MIDPEKRASPHVARKKHLRIGQDRPGKPVGNEAPNWKMNQGMIKAGVGLACGACLPLRGQHSLGAEFLPEQARRLFPI